MKQAPLQKAEILLREAAINFTDLMDQPVRHTDDRLFKKINQKLMTAARAYTKVYEATKLQRTISKSLKASGKHGLDTIIVP